MVYVWMLKITSVETDSFGGICDEEIHVTFIVLHAHLLPYSDVGLVGGSQSLLGNWSARLD